MWDKNSSYYEELADDDKLHYLKKLTLSNEVLLPDPFLIDEKEWSSDIKKLPDVRYPDIWNYLIETPSEYTKDKLKCYKSLEAYNFFVSGHVQDVFIFQIPDSSFSFVKTRVLPSQRQGQKKNYYQVWVTIHKNGWVLSANCTCMAGLGSACSHVSALLFKLQACTQLELNKDEACTSKLCEWNKSRKQAYPLPLNKINFKRPKKKENLPKVSSPFKGTLKGFCQSDPGKQSSESQRDFLEKLSSITPNAAILSCVSLDFHDDNMENSGDETETANEDEESCLPELLTSFFDPCSINYTVQKLSSVCKKLYNDYEQTTNAKHYENLRYLTMAQSESNSWMLYRAGRITSSNCKMAFTMNIEKPALSTIKAIMQYNDEINTPATKYGKQFEKVAFNAYNLEMQKQHVNFTASSTGIYVNVKNHFLGASPDGITTCDCHGLGLLEIKCPFKYREDLTDYKKDVNCPLKEDNSIKDNHQYYFQMQLQMLVTERSHCDFFVWSRTNHISIRVLKNEQFCETLLIKLRKVFTTVILPELVTRKNDPSNSNYQNVYCYCQRPSFKPMICCSNINCKIEWFHYSCVNLLRKPREDRQWFCPDCRKQLQC